MLSTYKYIFESSPAAIDVLDKNGMFIDMNKSSELLWEIDKSEFVNKKNIFDIERVKENLVLYNHLKKAMQQKEFSILECYNTYNNSKKNLWIRTTVYPAMKNDGEVECFVITNTDLTDLKRKEAERELIYDDLLYKSRIFEGLNTISSMLINCNSYDTLDKILEVIGDIIHPSRCYIYRMIPIDEKKLDYKLKCEHEYSRIDDSIVNGKTYTTNQLDLAAYTKRLLNKEIIIENYLIHKFLNKLNIKSLVLLPLQLNEKNIYGFIGFDCNYNRVWTETEILLLKNLTNIINSFIKRCEYEKRLNKFINDQNLILNNLDSYVWFFKNTNTYGFINDKFYNEFIKKEDLDKNSFKDDCLMDDCFNTEESQQQIDTNEQVLDTNEPLIYQQWLTNTKGEKRLLDIHKIPIERCKILCVATDITDKYNYETKMLSEFKELFNDKIEQIDKHIEEANKSLKETKKITEQSFINKIKERKT